MIRTPMSATIALPHGAWRRGLATSLLRLAQQLIRLAERIVRAHRRHGRVPPEIEFYAEAGAPEGALYVDGQLLGRLKGVTRL